MAERIRLPTLPEYAITAHQAAVASGELPPNPQLDRVLYHLKRNSWLLNCLSETSSHCSAYQGYKQQNGTEKSGADKELPGSRLPWVCGWCPPQIMSSIISIHPEFEQAEYTHGICPLCREELEQRDRAKRHGVVGQQIFPKPEVKPGPESSFGTNRRINGTS